MKSFTSLAVRFLSGETEGRYKHYHIEGDWLASHQQSESYPLAYRPTFRRVFVAYPHERVSRAYHILLDLARAKPSLRLHLANASLLAGGYSLAQRGALPAFGAGREMLLKAALLEIGDKITDIITASSYSTLYLLDTFCGEPMREELIKRWRWGGWEVVLPGRLVSGIKTMLMEDLNRRWKRFTPEDGVEVALRLLHLAAHAQKVRHRAMEWLRRKSKRKLLLVGRNGEYATLRLNDVELPPIYNTTTIKRFYRRAALVVQAALREALRRQDWKAGVFVQLAWMAGGSAAYIDAVSRPKEQRGSAFRDWLYWLTHVDLSAKEAATVLKVVELHRKMQIQQNGGA